MPPLADILPKLKQLRVAIPKTRRLPPSPQIEREEGMIRALAPPPHSGEIDKECPHESRIDMILRYKLLACDQRSFLTGSAVPDIEPAHILAPIRNDPVRKAEVEKFLTQQRFHCPQSKDFVLDSVENTILLESNLHIQWRDYGAFCFVPAEHDAKVMLAALRESNVEWEYQVRRDCDDRIRPLDLSQPPFRKPHWDVLILRPNSFLPEGQMIAIANERDLLVPGAKTMGHVSYKYPKSWSYWQQYGDILSNSHRCRFLKPFVVENVRQELELPQISSLAMIVNAQNKVQQYIDETDGRIAPRVRVYAGLLSDLVAAIFFVPSFMDNVAESSQVAIAARAHEVEGVSVDEHSFSDEEFAALWKEATDPCVGEKQRSDAMMKFMFHRMCSLLRSYLVPDINKLIGDNRQNWNRAGS
ncbi:hypothetical protein BDN70DRAFT_819137 [Pholiota conissans]|uniref:Uncharacterized protein n=1 Tax=Pholiota conissans TaxID=109636 RepID=A0A9P6CMS9_9AGAR|nr:hypothetical protein BDN70DRAFT_819137 [Pholiota conissans]